MSRLDHHVATVQNKLALGTFLSALAWLTMAYAGIVWIAVVADRMWQLGPRRPEIWFFAGLGAVALTALVYAIVRRPSAHVAAAAIDHELQLKEKFSTALYVRSEEDPFARAAVLDAERTAEQVSLRKRFQPGFPRAWIGTAAVALGAFLTLIWMPMLDLRGREKAQLQSIEIERKEQEAKQVVRRALARVNAMPAGVVDDEILKQAQRELTQLLNQPVRDPEQVKRSAARALQDMDDGIKQQMMNNQRLADAHNDARAFKSLMPSADEKGPVADAQRAIAKGNLSDAITQLEQAVKKFDEMSDQDKEKAAEQMARMAKQLQQMANDPEQRQQAQEQLEQLGLDQEQARQAMDLMEKAAAGDPLAQQQLQEMADQAMQQMNPQQQQQAQQMMRQLQSQMNTQQQAQQMQQAAQQMSQAMQQAAQGDGAMSDAAQQQMAQAQQAMQQQLEAMQAMRADAQQIAAAQQAAQDAAGEAAAALGGGGQQGEGEGNQQWAAGNPNWQEGPNNEGDPGQGPGGFGVGEGPRDFKAPAPYALKTELAPSEDVEDGKILASTLIKAQALVGESTASLQDVIAAAEQEAPDEIDQDRIGRKAQQAVREYFRSVTNDANQTQ